MAGFIILIILSLIICYKFGDWRHWKKYNSTMLFMILVNTLNDLLAYKKPLWVYDSLLFNDTITDLVVSSLIYTSTILVYIPHFPKKMWKRVIYVLLWSGLYIGVEYISYRTKHFRYLNGWNIFYSFLLDLFIFFVLILHFKKPLIAYVITAIAIIFVLWNFNINIMDLQ